MPFTQYINAAYRPARVIAHCLQLIVGAGFQRFYDGAAILQGAGQIQLAQPAEMSRP